jgi:drug/metabolite transporter (DMT)-like permease
MTDTLMVNYLLTLAVVLFTSIGHLLLKIAATRSSESGTRIYTHPLSILGYSIFAGVALLSIYAMKGLDLKVFFALYSLTYICIPVLAYFILKESFTRNKVIGVIVIALGVLLFSL